MDLKLELELLPVSDVDRAKAFYLDKVGFSLHVDHQPNDDFRVVQLNPPGSACSISIGKGITAAEPGSVVGLHLMVTDIEAACTELSGRGVDVDPIHHFADGQQRPGPDPEHVDYNSFSSFTDPDGNSWVLQERKAGPPGT